jgi:hypothetical protein
MQEGPFWSLPTNVLLVCVCVKPSTFYMTCHSYLHSWAQKEVIFGWHEAYLDNSKCSSVGYTLTVSPTLDSRGVNAVGDSVSGTDRGASAGSTDDEGAGPVGVDIGREQCHPS